MTGEYVSKFVWASVAYKKSTGLEHLKTGLQVWRHPLSALFIALEVPGSKSKCYEVLFFFQDRNMAGWHDMTACQLLTELLLLPFCNLQPTFSLYLDKRPPAPKQWQVFCLTWENALLSFSSELNWMYKELGRKLVGHLTPADTQDIPDLSWGDFVLLNCIPIHVFNS